MNFYYLANVRFPSERAHAAQIAHMCQAFAETGNNVTLFTNARGEGTRAATEECFGFKTAFRLVTLPPSKLYGETKLGFFIRQVLFVFFFWWRYGNDTIDVIYSRDEWVLFLLSYLMPHTKIVYESHEAKHNMAVRHLVNRNVPIIVISEGIRDRYIELGVPREQMLVAHDAIDDSFLEEPISQKEARERLGLPLDKKIAMYIGGFDAWKGVETFFKASELAPEVMFVAIGGKSDEITYFKTIYPKVTFLGPKPYKDLVYNQQAADVLVVPNSAETKLGAEYTSPLKLFAHMASGVPIIATNVPSIRNILSENLISFFLPGKSDVLAKVLKHNFIQPNGALRKANELRGKVKLYSWRERSKKILRFI